MAARRVGGVWVNNNGEPASVVVLVGADGSVLGALGAQSQSASLPVVEAPTTAFGYETLTVSTTALGPTSSVYAPSGQTPASVALIAVSAQGVNLRYDGGDPTATIGIPLAAGATFLVLGVANVAQIRLIRNGGADATVHLTYER